MRIGLIIALFLLTSLVKAQDQNVTGDARSRTIDSSFHGRVRTANQANEHLLAIDHDRHACFQLTRDVDGNDRQAGTDTTTRRYFRALSEAMVVIGRSFRTKSSPRK